jgi:hypothetical protein
VGKRALARQGRYASAQQLKRAPECVNNFETPRGKI